MSVQAMSWVIANSKHKGGELLTLLMIANYAGADGAGAWPSLERLAQDTRLSERAVQYHIQQLAKTGELRIEAKGGPHGSNLYSIAGMTQLLRSDIEDEKIALTKPASSRMTQKLRVRTKPTSPNPLIEPLINHPSKIARAQSEKTVVPKEYPISDELWSKAQKMGWRGSRELLERETEQFIDHWIAKAEKRVDWDASWRTWIRNAIKYGDDLERAAGGNGKASVPTRSPLDPSKYTGDGPYAHLFQQPQKAKEHG